MSPEQPVAPGGKKDIWILKRNIVIGGLLILGPLFLPFLWFSRQFSMTVKIVLTVLLVILSVLSYMYTPVLLDRILQQAQPLTPQ